MSSPSQSSNSSVLAEIYKYNPSSVIELYEVSLSPLSDYYASKGTPIATKVYRFHNGYNEKYGTVSPNVQWDGNSYSGRPIQMEGVQASSAGEIARPTFVAANHDLTFTQLNKSYANLIGAKVTRIRTLVKFIDSANFQTRNLFINTEAFDTWTVLNANVSPNITLAPNGTTTADKLVENTTANVGHNTLKSVSGLSDNTNICFSAYLKAAERQYAALGIQSKGGAGISAKSFDLVNGTVGPITRNLGPTILSSGITPVGNGWYRCWVVGSTQSGSPDRIPQFSIYIENNIDPSGLTYAGTVNSGIYIWGAQAEVVSNPTLTPTTYQAVGAAAGNPTADPNAKFPDDVYTIDRMVEEIPGQVTYELAPAWDVEGVQLPRRQIIANICPWVYKSDPCTWAYSGATTASFVSGSAGGTASFTATINTIDYSANLTIMTVSAVSSGTIRAGMIVTGGTSSSNTLIIAQRSGTTGGVGTYTVSKPQVSSTATGATPVGTHPNVPAKSSTGSGSGAQFRIVVASASASYSGATITVTNPGKNYATSEQVTIDGTYLGGASGSNDLVVSIGAITNTFVNENDIIVSTAAEDRCGKRLTSCKARFGTRALPFGGFPSAGLYGKPI